MSSAEASAPALFVESALPRADARLFLVLSAEWQSVNRNKILPLLLLGMVGCFSTLACIWDADTLENEIKKSPRIAEIITGAAQEPADTPRLEARIAELTAARRKEDPAWWNDLAGAYLRLGKPEEAVKLLEPVVTKFDSDYGIHANLGTAYHLLGRYQDAAREIARDIEINPAAHFGLERYHLALLEYLCKDAEYQKNHLYLDEWTELFFTSPADHFYEQSRLEADLAAQQKREMTGISAEAVDSTPLVDNWNLGTHPKWQEGVIYMATLNPKEPACFTMLGVVCLTKRDFNLAVAAFEKAIALGSPQAGLLQQKIEQAKKFIDTSHANAGRRTTAKIAGGSMMSVAFMFIIPLVLLVAAILFFRVARGLKG